MLDVTLPSVSTDVHVFLYAQHTYSRASLLVYLLPHLASILFWEKACSLVEDILLLAVCTVPIITNSYGIDDLTVLPQVTSLFLLQKAVIPCPEQWWCILTSFSGMLWTHDTDAYSLNLGDAFEPGGRGQRFLCGLKNLTFASFKKKSNKYVKTLTLCGTS
jgi:hypothetical protein